MNRIILIGAIVLLFLAVGAFALTQNFKNLTSQTPAPTNSEMLDNGSQTAITTADVSYFPEATGYFVRPEDAGNYPGVVMIHENRGLRPEIKDTAENLAREGYMVLAVDLYKGNVLETQDEAREYSPNFDQQEGIENLQAAAAFLREQGATKLASLGWCFGGRQSVELSTSGETLDATVVYYGGGMATSVEELEPINWPVLGVFGDQDSAIPVETVREFETSLNTLSVENEIHIYQGVGHAFANPSGQNYAPDETMDAWNKTLNFLNRHLKTN